MRVTSFGGDRRILSCMSGSFIVVGDLRKDPCGRSAVELKYFLVTVYLRNYVRLSIGCGACRLRTNSLLLNLPGAVVDRTVMDPGRGVELTTFSARFLRHIIGVRGSA